MKSGFFQMESYRKGVFLSSTANVIAQLFGFITNLMVAYYFGAQTKTDVYFYCVTIVTLMATFITTLDSAVIMPEAMRLAEQVSPLAAMRFVNLFFYGFLAICAVITLIMFVQPIDFFLLISRFSPEILKQNSQLVFWTIPLLGLLVLSQFLLDLLSIYKFFTLPMFSSIVNRLLTLLSIVFFGKYFDVLSLIWASLAATILQIIFCLLVLKKVAAWRFNCMDRRLEKRVAHNVLFALSGHITSTFAAGIPLSLLTGFPSGVLTAMNYAQRLALMPLMMFSNQLSTVIGIKFNEHIAKRQWPSVRRAFHQASFASSTIMVPLALFCFVFGHELVRLCLQRGSFDANATHLAGHYFKYFILALPFVTIHQLVARIFMATQKTKQALGYQLTFNAGLITALILLMHYWGAAAFPLTYSTFYFIGTLLLMAVCHLCLPEVGYTKAMRNLFIVSIPSVLVALVVNKFKPFLAVRFGSFSFVIGAIVFAVVPAFHLLQIWRSNVFWKQDTL